jgi:hypothetical protein
MRSAAGPLVADMPPPAPTPARLFSVLILGGYGTFGSRLAQLLAEDPRLKLIIAGRSARAGEALCARLPPGAARTAQKLDRDGDIGEALRALAPNLIIDASGPFQAYGRDPYRVVRAALALGIDYLDLADGSDFVDGIAQFDAEARERGIFLLSGASTCPVLTAAVLWNLTRGMARLDAVTAGIAPSPAAGVGLSVVRAIAGYAGKPVRLKHGGRWAVGHAFTQTMCATIAPPGHLPLGPLRFSLVDVPDLRVLPALWPELRTVFVGAAPRPAALHAVLRALAWLVRLRLVASLAALGRLMHRASLRLRWGEPRGGMFVAVTGAGADGETIERSWHLLAEGDDGPFVPAMAAAALIARCLVGAPPAAGARPATRELDLTDYEALFTRCRIDTGCRTRAAGHARLPLFRRLLGEAYDALPQPLQAMHDLAAPQRRVARGIGSIERGSGWLARLAAWPFRFPPAAAHVPVTVTFRATAGQEIWERRFGEASFASTQTAGSGRFDGLLCETFGPLRFGIALVVADGRLHYVVRRWSFGAIPLPSRLAPRGATWESADNGRFNFRVEIALPVLGPMVRYHGWLTPDEPAPEGTGK